MSGNLPTDWKLARVVPVPKSKNLNSPASYRPISILSIISKIMERCVHVYRIITGWSTTSALLSVTHDWLQYLERGNKVCSVYLDIRKAFDSVPHSLLIQKLTNIQVDPYVVQWINCYLAERSQMVVVGGIYSPCSLRRAPGLSLRSFTIFDIHE